jgi:Cytochrome c554 and c-prime
MARTNLALLVALVVACGLTTGFGQELPGHPASQTGMPSTAGGGIGRTKYVGDNDCLSCHQDRALLYLRTAHHLTSQPAGKGSILGSFQNGSNVLTIADPAAAEDNPGLYFLMEAKHDGYYQTAVTGWPGLLQKRSERIDIVIGSGVRGQSYLYWHDDQLYELPVSYWSDGQRWINSPGYRNGAMDFFRPVDPRCLECHVTSIQPRSADPSTNSYHKDSLVTGISCETCHGPGADHVALHRAKSSGIRSTGEAILNPKGFSRDRQVDLCSLCHNGLRQKEVAPAFSFVPGQPLDNYLLLEAGHAEEQPNVHGDQVGLLKKSRCYLSSPKMSCSTCHDVHAPEQPAAWYSSRCLSCHRIDSCGMSKTMGPKIANNCIDCHMPVQSTTAIVSDTAGRIIRPKMRTHWIKVYR